MPFRLRARTSVVLVLASFLIIAASCAVQQAVQSRKKAVQHAKGAEVSGGQLDRPIEHVGTLRVYASGDYRAQHPSWESQITAMVDASGEILGPAFGVRLEVLETRPWDPTCNPADLQACLAELAAHDPRDDVDWVVGLMPSMSRFTVSFDELGMASLPGRHLLLRDLYTQGEREVINQSFHMMSASKRSEIYKERQKHKRLVIFLHEWGHTMGALHTTRDDTILYPAYDSEMAGFSDENLRLIDASLKDRFPFDPSYPTLAKFLTDAQGTYWTAGSREALLAALQGSVPPASGANRSHRATVLLVGVSPQDRGQYSKAEQQYEANELEASWESLAPLVGKYPSCYAIQHFGCTVAMMLGASEAGDACRRAIELVSQQR